MVRFYGSGNVESYKLLVLYKSNARKLARPTDGTLQTLSTFAATSSLSLRWLASGAKGRQPVKTFAVEDVLAAE